MLLLSPFGRGTLGYQQKKQKRIKKHVPSCRLPSFLIRMVFPAHEYRRRLRAFGNNLVLAGRLNALEDQNDPDRAVYGVTKFARASFCVVAWHG